MTKAQQRLHEFTSGHPEAVQGLREYQAVVEAAVATFQSEIDFVEYSEKVNLLHDALCNGGFMPMRCPFPINHDDGTAEMCIRNGHCGCVKGKK